MIGAGTRQRAIPPESREVLGKRVIAAPAGVNPILAPAAAVVGGGRSRRHSAGVHPIHAVGKEFSLADVAGVMTPRDIGSNHFKMRGPQSSPRDLASSLCPLHSTNHS